MYVCFVLRPFLRFLYLPRQRQRHLLSVPVSVSGGVNMRAHVFVLYYVSSCMLFCCASVYVRACMCTMHVFVCSCVVCVCL